MCLNHDNILDLEYIHRKYISPVGSSLNLCPQLLAVLAGCDLVYLVTMLLESIRKFGLETRFSISPPPSHTYPCLALYRLTPQIFRPPKVLCLPPLAKSLRKNVDTSVISFLSRLHLLLIPHLLFPLNAISMMASVYMTLALAVERWIIIKVT